VRMRPAHRLVDDSRGGVRTSVTTGPDYVRIQRVDRLRWEWTVYERDDPDRPLLREIAHGKTVTRRGAKRRSKRTRRGLARAAGL
jgi:hypothetical protein